MACRSRLALGRALQIHFFPALPLQQFPIARCCNLQNRCKREQSSCLKLGLVLFFETIVQRLDSEIPGGCAYDEHPGHVPLLSGRSDSYSTSWKGEPSCNRFFRRDRHLLESAPEMSLLRS